MTSAIAHRVRQRIGQRVSRCLADSEALTVGLAATCDNHGELIEFLLDRQVARELKLVPKKEMALTFEEHSALFANVRAARSDAMLALLGGVKLKEFVARVERDLECTICERDQKAAWALAATRVLAFLVIHSEFDTEEKFSHAVGGVVRSDLRRLEDLRASYEGRGACVISVGGAIQSLVGVSCM